MKCGHVMWGRTRDVHHRINNVRIERKGMVIFGIQKTVKHRVKCFSLNAEVTNGNETAEDMQPLTLISTNVVNDLTSMPYGK
jgi:hypothetical protein